MKRAKKILCGIFLIALLLCGWSPVAASEGSNGVGTTHELKDNGDLLTLMASDAVRDGDTIVLQGTVNVNDPKSDSAPWVINKAVTIRGGTVDLRAGGILLGADVSFDGVKLSFANRIRNAVMANGYTLSLNNVSQDSSANAVHLFCGGLTGHSTTAVSGTHGRIIIAGSTSLGNIYGGSMSSDGNGNVWSFPSSVVIDSSATGSMGEFYACGAVETLVDENEMLNPDYVVAPPLANEDGFRVTAPVSIELWQGIVKNVDGSTGGEKNASVTYRGNGNLSTPALINIGDLTVASGNLAPKNSSLSGSISASSDAILDLSGFGDELTVTDFAGGGTVNLGEQQTLTVTGTVSGETFVGIGGIFGGESQGTIDNEHVYIAAAKSDEDSFVLLPPQNNPNAIFLRHENGNWSVPAVETEGVIVNSASVSPEIEVDSDVNYIMIPVEVSYGSDPYSSYFSEVPVEISIGDEVAEMICGDYGYEYTFSDEFAFSLGYFSPDEDGELLNLEAEEPVANGRYTVTITIPAEYMADGKELTLSTVLLVGEKSDEEQFEISAVRCDEGVLVQLPQSLWGKRIIAAAYNEQNQMVEVSGATVNGETVVLPVMGETICVFIVGERYQPILPVLQIP